MREKNRLSRSLRLESLEARTVFSVDGFGDAPRGVVLPPQITIEHFYRGHVQVTAIWITMSSSRDGDHGGPRSGSKSPNLTDFHDDHGLPVPEGEATTGITLDKPSIAIQPPATPNVALAPKPAILTQIGSASRTALDNAPTSVGQPNHSLNASSPVLLANRSTPAISLQPATSPFNSSSTTSPSQLGAPGFGKSEVLFDFSGRTGPVLSNRLSLGNLPNDDFRFSQAAVRADDSTLAAELVDRAMLNGVQGITSLDKLLTLLANKHRQNQSSRDPESEASPSRLEFSEHDHQNSATVEKERVYGDGGLIALGLNRDLTPSDLDELAKSVQRENSAWVASVGIFRSSETGALAAASRALQVERTKPDFKLGSKSEASPIEASDVDANETLFHPVIASSTALAGAVLLSLRRIRKSARLLYTKS